MKTLWSQSSYIWVRIFNHGINNLEFQDPCYTPDKLPKSTWNYIFSAFYGPQTQNFYELAFYAHLKSQTVGTPLQQYIKLFKALFSKHLYLEDTKRRDVDFQRIIDIIACQLHFTGLVFQQIVISISKSMALSQNIFFFLKLIN